MWVKSCIKLYFVIGMKLVFEYIFSRKCREYEKLILTKCCLYTKIMITIIIYKSGSRYMKAGFGELY